MRNIVDIYPEMFCEPGKDKTYLNWFLFEVAKSIEDAIGFMYFHQDETLEEINSWIEAMEGSYFSSPLLDKNLIQKDSILWINLMMEPFLYSFCNYINSNVNPNILEFQKLERDLSKRMNPKKIDFKIEHDKKNLMKCALFIDLPIVEAVYPEMDEDHYLKVRRSLLLKLSSLVGDCLLCPNKCWDKLSKKCPKFKDADLDKLSSCRQSNEYSSPAFESFSIHDKLSEDSDDLDLSDVLNTLMQKHLGVDKNFDDVEFDDYFPSLEFAHEMYFKEFEKSKLSSKKKKQSVYQFKLMISGTKPPIWRRILVSSKITFEKLNKIIVDYFYWSGTHLHQFLLKFNNKTNHFLSVGPEVKHEYDVEYDIDEKEIKLDMFFSKTRKNAKYIYDFGDNWEIKITLEKIYNPSDFRSKSILRQLPICVKAKGAGPIEDCGGIYGYSELLESLKDKRSPGYKYYEDLIYEDFDPDDPGIEVENLKKLLKDNGVKKKSTKKKTTKKKTTKKKSTKKKSTKKKSTKKKSTKKKSTKKKSTKKKSTKKKSTKKKTTKKNMNRTLF